MGNKQSASPDATATTATTATPSATAGASGGGGCPVRHVPKKGDARSSSPDATASGGGDVCPVRHVPKKGDPEAGKGWNTNNNMPAQPAQAPAPGQKAALDTTRVKSNIPKGGDASGTWEYPSPQMFWNAMVRKGKKGDSDESDMEYVRGGKEPR